MFRFESPWMFLLLALVPLVFYWGGRGKPRGSLRFSSLDNARLAGRSWRQRLLFVPAALRVAALVVCVIALARPQMGTETVLDTSRGIAIEMVVDRSSSMSASFGGTLARTNRLDVALELFEDFVNGTGGDLAGRPGDLIGVITFARYADTICPLTLSHDAVTGFLPTIKMVERDSEDGTAIGDAVALAAARLKTAEEMLQPQAGTSQDYEIKSKVIILLTDGENNAGRRTPQEAAELAAAWGIKIYAIGIGGESTRTIQTPLGTYSVPTTRVIDEESLRSLARTTGGIYRFADDVDALRQVYAEIDQLEKSEIESTRYLDYRELFPPFLAAALGLLVIEMLLGSTVLRRIP